MVSDGNPAVAKAEGSCRRIPGDLDGEANEKRVFVKVLLTPAFQGTKFKAPLSGPAFISTVRSP